VASDLALFLYDDLYRTFGGTWSALTTASGYNAANLGNDLRQVIHKSTSKASQWIQFSAPAAKTSNAIAIIDHNFTSSATIEVKTSTASDFLSGVTSQGTPTYRAGIIWHTFSGGSGSRRYYRLYVDDPSNTNDFLTIGRVLIGNFFAPANNYEANFDRPDEDLSLRQTAIGGVETHVVRPILSRRPLVFPISTQAQLELWEDFANAVGDHAPFAAILAPDNRPVRESFYCKFADFPNFPRVFGLDVNEARVMLREAA
jgi:hypothetical protein